MAEELSQVHLTGQQIRVLAHPLRVRLLGRLRAEGPATATGLAGLLGTNTGATSYHLRQLAEAGLVIDVERPGAGRQRWWRAAHDMSSWHRSYYLDDPDATAAADWLEAFQANRFVELAEQWRHGLPDEPAEWRDTGGLSDYLLHMDPGQVRALLDDVEALIERHVAASQADPRPGARKIAFYLAALPTNEEGDRAPAAAHAGWPHAQAEAGTAQPTDAGRVSGEADAGHVRAADTGRAPAAAEVVRTATAADDDAVLGVEEDR
ncbi:winged helix-turn-helix domain-containing protein [Actinoplanes sp. NPDC024001]|uniref:winged helix-turn-helix domain-containing protein n=1 Tax=Actinoplanes sp. NPDC024001 TaxID=3154598 RepID=UPI0033FDC964